jgi:hypothetical protein
MKRWLLPLMLLCVSFVGFAQSHKYYLEGGILTATQLGGGKYVLKTDTKSGERLLYFTFNKVEGDVYAYDLIKVDEETLTEYQRSISYLKTRTKFSDLCTGKGGELFIKILGESEIITLPGK